MPAKKKNRNKKKGKVNNELQPPRSLDPCETDSTTYTAILVIQLKTGGGMVAGARNEFSRVLQGGNLYVENLSGKQFFGNRGGLGFAAKNLKQFEELKASYEKLKASHEKLEASHKGLQDDKQTLVGKVGTLIVPFESYLKIRNRFISTFKRDRPITTDDRDQSIIKEGNSVAHGGDIVVDAQLYEGKYKTRTDCEVFEVLYGVPPGVVVQKLKEKSTFDVLNKYASVISSDRMTISDDFGERFTTFIKLLKDSDWDESCYVERRNRSLLAANRSLQSYI